MPVAAASRYLLLTASNCLILNSDSQSAGKLPVSLLSPTEKDTRPGMLLSPGMDPPKALMETSRYCKAVRGRQPGAHHSSYCAADSHSGTRCEEAKPR